MIGAVRAKYIFYTHSIILAFWLFLYSYFVKTFWKINFLLWEKGQVFLVISFVFMLLFIIVIMLYLWRRSWLAFRIKNYEKTIKNSVFAIGFMVLPLFFVWLLN